MPSGDEEAKVCPNCGTEPIYAEEFGKYYCFSCNDFIEPQKKGILQEVQEIAESKPSEEVVCPSCGKSPTYIEEYDRYYCYSCNEYLEPIKKDQEKQLDVLVKEPTEEGEMEAESEKEIVEEKVGLEEKETKKKPAGKRKKKYSKYRYRTRLIKGSILPILFGVISIQMLNLYIYEFPGYFDYEIMMILGGFLLGFFSISGLTLANLIRAKGKGKIGCNLNIKVGFIVYIPFLIILFTLALFVSISTAWQFSTGFFLAAIFPILIVFTYEATSKGKFFVKEYANDPSKGRKLVFIQ